jgi:dihydroorotase
MHNTKPPTTSADALAAKVAAATNRMHCDFAFFVGATHDNIDHLGELECLPGAAGIKIFAGSSTGDLLVDDEDELARLLATIRRRCAFHSECESRLKERVSVQREGDPSSHSEWRDVTAALASTERLLRLATAAGKRSHILHVSTGAEMELLSLHKDVASVEVTPQHLTLATPDAYERLGTRAQMNPPLRDRAHQEILWWGLQQGVVQPCVDELCAGSRGLRHRGCRFRAAGAVEGAAMGRRGFRRAGSGGSGTTVTKRGPCLRLA